MDAKRTSLFMLPWISLLPTCGIAIAPSDSQAFFQLSIGEVRAETGPSVSNGNVEISAARRRGPKQRDKEDTGRTIQAAAASTPQAITASEGPTEIGGQRRGGPKGDGGSGLQQPADFSGNQAITTTLGPNWIEGQQGVKPKGDKGHGIQAPTVISGEARPRGPKVRTKELTN